MKKRIASQKNHFLFGLLVLGGLLVSPSCKKDSVYDQLNTLKINQIQVIASHNSYRVHTYQPIYDFVLALAAQLPPEYDPTGWDYGHPSFEEQFNNYNVRGLEIDFYNDPNGGLFYNRQGLAYVGEPVESNEPDLLLPGLKVLHIPDVDYMTNYLTFKSSLRAVKAWSLAHPTHLPIFINLESKEETVADVQPLPGFVHSVPFDDVMADSIDSEIRSVFGDNLDMVITPDDVRGTYATLEAAALAGNWPTLKEARGKIIFIMEGPSVSFYKNNHPSLAGRACFVYADPGTPEAAFVILNGAINNQTEISQRVSQGYIVRTRADSDTDEARTGDYSSMNAAFNSWAQIVSTDYYRPDARGVAQDSGWTDYTVQFPNGELARVNGLSAPEGLRNIGMLSEE